MNQNKYDNDKAQRIARPSSQHESAPIRSRSRKVKKPVFEEQVATPVEQLAEIIAGDVNISNVEGTQLAIELGMRMQQLEDGTFCGHFRVQNKLVLEQSGLTEDSIAKITKVLGGFKQELEARQREEAISSKFWRGPSSRSR